MLEFCQTTFLLSYQCESLKELYIFMDVNDDLSQLIKIAGDQY